MGYRSDVAAAFYVANTKDLPALKLWLSENFPMEQFDTDITWFDRGMLMHCESVKWYDDFDEVRAFNAAVEAYTELCTNLPPANPDEPSYSFEFVRIGENYEDIETREEGHGCEWFLEVNRSIRIGINK